MRKRPSQPVINLSGATVLLGAEKANVAEAKRRKEEEEDAYEEDALGKR